VFNANFEFESSQVFIAKCSAFNQSSKAFIPDTKNFDKFL
jgi:hypothetical protein